MSQKDFKLLKKKRSEAKRREEKRREEKRREEKRREEKGDNVVKNREMKRYRIEKEIKRRKLRG